MTAGGKKTRFKETVGAVHLESKRNGRTRICTILRLTNVSALLSSHHRKLQMD